MKWIVNILGMFGTAIGGMGINLYIIGGLLLTLGGLGLYGWHLYDRIDTLQLEAGQAKQALKDTNDAFDKFRADTKKADEIVAKSAKKNTDVSTKIDKAHQEIHNEKDANTVITKPLADALNSVRQLKSAH